MNLSSRIVSIIILSLLAFACQDEENNKGCLTGLSKDSGERERIACITEQQFNCARELMATGTNTEAYNKVKDKPVCSNGSGGATNTWNAYTDHKWENCDCD